ncbi:hypothetical protein HK097_006253, partial [Rhizophlyctis rosea]
MLGYPTTPVMQPEVRATQVKPPDTGAVVGRVEPVGGKESERERADATKGDAPKPAVESKDDDGKVLVSDKEEIEKIAEVAIQDPVPNPVNVHEGKTDTPNANEDQSGERDKPSATPESVAQLPGTVEVNGDTQKEMSSPPEQPADSVSKDTPATETHEAPSDTDHVDIVSTDA